MCLLRNIYHLCSWHGAIDLPMPHKRSYKNALYNGKVLSYQQRRRRLQDRWYAWQWPASSGSKNVDTISSSSRHFNAECEFGLRGAEHTRKVDLWSLLSDDSERAASESQAGGSTAKNSEQRRPAGVSVALASKEFLESTRCLPACAKCNLNKEIYMLKA